MISDLAKNKKYKIDGHGTIEIDIAETKRNFFPSQIDNTINFSLEILGVNQVVEKHDQFFLFEWQPVSFIMVFNDISAKNEYSLLVNNKPVAESKKVDPIRLLNSSFTFQDQVGITEFKIVSPSGQVIFKLVTEVFPQKMDYKSDYKAIMEDISKIIHNLTYSILRDTYQKAKPKVAGNTTEVEWWNILDSLFNALIKSFEIIRRNPKHDIISEEKVRQIDRVKKHSMKNRVWLQKNSKHVSNNPKHGVELIKGKYFSHALSLKKKITYDNYENRFIKFAANQTIYRLISFKREIEINEYIGSINLTKSIDNYISRISGILMQSPFNEVGVFEKQNYFSTTLTKASGYKDFLQIHLLLQKGLEILNDDIFKIESKNISKLYEYWCFLKLTDTVMRLSNFQVKYQDLIKIQTGKFKVDLKEGNQSKVKLRNSSNEEITIYFNKVFNRNSKKTFTFTQKPDHSIKFTKEGYDKPFWFIFDAKYRFNEKEENYDVPDDAIGQLHRYRDAILHSEFNVENTSYKATIKSLGGIILYPYPKTEKEYQSSKYFKSIDEVNIGALPMLPSKTSLIENYLRKLFIEKSPEDHFQEFIGMDYSEYVSKREEFDKTVTIGIIKSSKQKERLKYLNDNNIHYIPFVKDDKSRIYRSEFILITKSKETDAELRKVKRWEIMSREELKKTGTSWNLNHKKYIVFHLETIHETIQISKDIVPVNFRYTTLRGLNLFRKEKNKNALYLTNESAYRLYSVLKRKNIDFKIEWSRNPDDFTSVIFNLSQNRKIESSDKIQMSHFKLNGKIVSLTNLLDSGTL